MKHLFIERLLTKRVKVAEIDPTLQWGIAGAGIGAGGALFKSLIDAAASDAPMQQQARDAIRSALIASAFGAGAGLATSAGIRGMGYDVKTPGQLASDLDNVPLTSFPASVGVGAAGALGLYGLGHYADVYHKNQALNRLIQQAPDLATVSSEWPRSINLDAVQNLLRRAQRFGDLLVVRRGGADKVPLSVWERLIGRDVYRRALDLVTQRRIDALLKNKDVAAAENLRRMVDDFILAAKNDPRVLQSFGPQPSSIGKWLSRAKEGKGLLAAGLGLGGAHYALTNLYDALS